MNEAEWSKQEFGDAALGDCRRTDRLVAMGARMAAQPAGNVTAVFAISAEREGAFRFLENDDVAAAKITEAAARAAAQRADEDRIVFAAVDGSSLNLPDASGRRGLGRVGTRKADAQGLLVMTAIAIGSTGTPLGIIGQHYWTRDRRAPKKKAASRLRRNVKEKETQHWLTVMAQAKTAFADVAPNTRLWFQLDRGGDAWPILSAAHDDSHWLTVRAAWDRRLVTTDEKQRYLWETMEKADVTGSYGLDVPALTNKRAARAAVMVVRAAEVTLDLVARPASARLPTRVWAVWTREEGTCPEGEEPIEWMLLTDYPVSNLADAQLVIRGYAERWRIEQFHRIWKSGACNVEDTQLGDRDHIITWATLHASVAMRIMRLTYLSRTRPEEPASVELSRNEVDAAILVSETKKFKRGDVLTIGQVILLIAECGGYTGKSSGGPPGALVLARGLRRVETVAKVLDKL